MGGIFAVLALLAYLFLVIDWKETRTVLAQGGWAASCFFIALAILIAAVLVNYPDATAVPHGAVHHG